MLQCESLLAVLISPEGGTAAHGVDNCRQRCSVRDRLNDCNILYKLLTI